MADDHIPPEISTLTPEQTAAAMECRFVPQSSSDLSERRQYQLAYFWMTGYFVMYGSYFYMAFQGTNADVLQSMKETLNYLTPFTGLVLGFFYTASVSNRRKDEALASAAATPTVVKAP